MPLLGMYDEEGTALIMFAKRVERRSEMVLWSYILYTVGRLGRCEIGYVSLFG